MKKLTFIFIFFLMINNIFAQGYSVGLRFKGLTVGSNFNSAYLFSLEGNYGIDKYNISVLTLTYQLRYPKVKYRKFINCSTVDYSASRPLIPVEYSEFVNLSMLLWSFGLQFNF